MNRSSCTETGIGLALDVKGPGGMKLAYSVEDFAAATGFGRTRVYEAIKNRQLRARKYGKRTVILVEDGRAFLASLPELGAA